MTHPGEKRMQTICSKECNILPNNFDANLYRLFDGMFRKNISGVINDIRDTQYIAAPPFLSYILSNYGYHLQSGILYFYAKIFM